MVLVVMIQVATGKSLANVQFSGNNTVKGDLYAGNVNIDSGKTVNFDRGTNNTNPKTLNLPNAIVDGTPLPRSLQLFTYLTDVAASNFNFADSTSSAEFKDAVLVNAPINNGGTVKFDQNVWFKEEVKNVQRLEFSPNTSVILEKNIQAGTLIADKAKLILTANSVVEGDLNVTDAILDLTNYELKHTGNVTHNGTLNIITYFDTTLKTGGHILVDQDSSYDMSNLNKIIINVVSRSDTTKIAKGDKHQIVTLNEGATFSPYPNSDVTINSSDTGNKWVNWVSDGTGFALVADDVDGGGGGNGSGGLDPSVINPITNPIASGIATQLANNVKDSNTTSSAAQLKKDLEAMPTNTMIETLDRLGHRVNIAEVSEGVGEFTNMELQNILTDVAINMDNLTSEGIFGRLEELGDETRLSGLNEPNSTLKNNNTSGRRRTINRTQAATTAGDEDNIGTGVWGVPFYGIATQKSKNGVSGYKSNTGGGIIGIDYAVDDSIVLGAAYTRAESKLRHKNTKIGDKTKATSNIFSVYGLYNWLQNNLFAEFIGSYGRNRIKNKEKRITSTGNQTAIGQFTNSFYSGELLGGYNYVIPNSNLTTLTPMLGIRYATFKNNSYNENGTTFQNLSVRRNSYNKFEGIIGLKGTTNFFVENIILKPELHGFINYNFNNKTPNIAAYLDGNDELLTTIGFKPAKALYNVGCGVSTRYNMLELGIRYNLSLAKKYIANQGSLKIKVNLQINIDFLT